MYGVKRQDIINWLRDTTSASECVLVDDINNFTRHVCLGGDRVWVLNVESATYPVDIMNGVYLTIEYFLCRGCGKLLINKNSLDLGL